MLFIVSFLLFRQKAFFGLPTGKPNKKKARIAASLSNLKQKIITTNYTMKNY